MSQRVFTMIAGLLLVVAVFGVAAWVLMGNDGKQRRTASLPEPLEDRDPDLNPSDKPMVKGPNVVILLWDTTRADRMSVYGYERPTTPFVEEFAKNGRVYEKALSPGIWTVPAHASVFTGLPASSVGASPEWIWLDGRFETMAEFYLGLGYDTFAWSSNPYLSEASNLLQGFETVALSWKGEHAMAAAEATREKLIARDASSEISPAWQPSGRGKGWPRHLTAYKDAGPVASDVFEDWLHTRPSAERPFFAYVNMLEAHHPRVPSDKARKQVIQDDALIEAGLKTEASLYRTMASMEGKASFSPEELKAVNAVYDASLADLDAASEKLVGVLDAQGYLNNTIVVIMSDHGEHLGENGMFDHRWSIDQELIHVPLIIRGPGVRAGRVKEPVSTAALFASLAELTGQKAPQQVVRPLGQGRYILSELLAPMDRLPFIKRAHPNLDPNRWNRRMMSVMDRKNKWVFSSDKKHGLFDLEQDPTEDNNLFDADRSNNERRLNAFVRRARNMPKYNPNLRTEADQPQNALKADPSMREQLKMLGYAE